MLLGFMSHQSWDQPPCPRLVLPSFGAALPEASSAACCTNGAQVVQCVYLSVFFLIGTFNICLA